MRDLDLKTVYRSGKDDLFRDFYSKCLRESISYDRGVGYFSSQLLAASATGLSRFVSNKGKMRLIIGNPLSEDEFQAVKKGDDLKESLTRELSEKLAKMLLDLECKTKLELLTYLIACGRLEIKFAIRRAGMYHEKIGIMHDKEGNILVFQGSANETPHGLMPGLNSESLSVYKSWDRSIFESYGQEFLDGFEGLWKNSETGTIIVDVPSDVYQNISDSYVQRGKQEPGSAYFDYLEQYHSGIRGELNYEPRVPDEIGGRAFNIYDHQRIALERWQASSYKGILKLATGSGKTITSIYGAVKIFSARKALGKKLCLVISVPYVQLALQWVENLEFFNIIPIQCFDSTKEWSDKLKSEINYFIAGKKKFMCVVVVNKTMGSVNFAKIINRLADDEIMFIGDECHNHGSENLVTKLPLSFYRLGLSATPFRADDDELELPFPNDARDRILSYYGDIVAEYGLAEAINDGVLSPYEYHIVPVELTEDEQDKYDDLSYKIVNLISGGGRNLSEEKSKSLTMLCGARSRLLGSACGKLRELEQLTKNIAKGDRRFTLFYVGEGLPFDLPDGNDQDSAIIDQVSEILVRNSWRVSKFTGAVSKHDRKEVLDSFKAGDIDGLVAMKVLDEGIDVPACKTAFVMASTKNPRQYVQRRGRILRKSKGKQSAKIFDFVVIPRVGSAFRKALLKSEADRVNDFALLATNKYEIEKDMEHYGLAYDFI